MHIASGKTYVEFFKNQFWGLYYHCVKYRNFHLTSWYENFMEKHIFLHSFKRFARNYEETAFPRNFHTRKLGEITVFYAVYLI